MGRRHRGRRHRERHRGRRHRGQHRGQQRVMLGRMWAGMVGVIAGHHPPFMPSLSSVRLVLVRVRLRSGS